MGAYDRSLLGHFKIFSDFNETQFAYINQYIQQIEIPARKKILKIGAQHDKIFLLLAGELKLAAADGKEITVSADSSSAKNPIAQIRPSRYDVSSLTDVKLIILTKEALSLALNIDETMSDESKNISVDYLDNHHHSYDKILFDILTLLHQDQLVLPSLPDIAFKIRQTVESDTSNAQEIVSVINMDQSIVTKVLRMANSAMYNNTGKKIESCKAAYLRIGSKKLVNLVLSFTMKELFNTDLDVIKKKMNEVWKHSVKVAAISAILTRLTSNLDPEKALLAGLLHNIGSVAILNNLNNMPEVAEDDQLLSQILYGLQSEVGESILTNWNFPDELITVAKYSTEWFKKDNINTNYSDIVNIAQLHAFIGTPYQHNLPAIDDLPAFKNKALNKLTPELSIRIINKAEEEIKQTIDYFN